MERPCVLRAGVKSCVVVGHHCVGGEVGVGGEGVGIVRTSTGFTGGPVAAGAAAVPGVAELDAERVLGGTAARRPDVWRVLK